MESGEERRGRESVTAAERVPVLPECSSGAHMGREGKGGRWWRGMFPAPAGITYFNGPWMRQISMSHIPTKRAGKVALVFLIWMFICILDYRTGGTQREKRELLTDERSLHSYLPHFATQSPAERHACNCTCIHRDEDNTDYDGPILTRDYYEPGFRIPGAHLCPSGGDGIKLLMVVQSRPGNEDVRRTLRRTWVRPAIQRKDVLTFFLVARTNDSKVQRGIELENERFGDIVQANFVDHYNNLTLKSLATLEWADTFCPRAHFVFKADDDLYVHVDNLMTFIDHHYDERNVLFGNLVANPRPDRNPDSVFYVSKALWEKDMYPPYLGGPMYLISSDAVCRIFQILMSRPYLFIEDVAVTGIGAELAGVRRQRAPEMYTYSVESDDTCRFRVLIGAHRIPTVHLRRIHRAVRKADGQCREYTPTLWDHCISVEEQVPLKKCVMDLDPELEFSQDVQ